MKDYQTVKKLADAQVTSQEYPWHYASVLDDQGLIELRKENRFTWYHANGLITVFPLQLHKGGPVPIDTAPEGVEYLTYKRPDKQYVVINGNDGQARFYLLPPYKAHNWNWKPARRGALGLTLMPHPEMLYVPVEAIPDYEVSVSRKLKNAGMAKWSDFFAYVQTMWDLLPENPSNWADIRDEYLDDGAYRPYPHIRKSWFTTVQYWRHQGWSSLGYQRQLISKFVMVDDLPYNVVRVSPLRSSHTDHWSPELIKQLGLAGRLDDIPEE